MSKEENPETGRVAEIKPDPTLMAKATACVCTVTGAVLLALALMVECLKLVHAVLGLVQLGCAAFLFWWLWHNRYALANLKKKSSSG